MSASLSLIFYEKRNSLFIKEKQIKTGMRYPTQLLGWLQSKQTKKTQVLIAGKDTQLQIISYATCWNV